MKSLNILLLAAIFACPTLLPAQTSDEAPPQKVREAGIQINSITNWSALYRSGTEKGVWRFGLFGVDVVNQTSNPSTTVSTDIFRIGVGMRGGYEFRQPISENLSLRYGGDLSFQYTYQDFTTTNTGPLAMTNQNSTSIVSPGIIAVLGVNYVLQDHWVFGAELNPGIIASYQTNTQFDENGDQTGQSTDLDFVLDVSTAQSLNLSIAYRF